MKHMFPGSVLNNLITLLVLIVANLYMWNIVKPRSASLALKLANLRNRSLFLFFRRFLFLIGLLLAIDILIKIFRK